MCTCEDDSCSHCLYRFTYIMTKVLEDLLQTHLNKKDILDYLVKYIKKDTGLVYFTEGEENFCFIINCKLGNVLEAFYETMGMMFSEDCSLTFYLHGTANQIGELVCHKDSFLNL